MNLTTEEWYELVKRLEAEAFVEEIENVGRKKETD